MSPSKSGPGMPPRLRPMLLFILLTIMTFGGPMAIVIVGQGGDRPTWPPDRPVEWWVFGIVTIGYVLLLGACILDASLTLRRNRQNSAQSPPEDRPVDDSTPRKGNGPEAHP